MNIRTRTSIRAFGLFVAVVFASYGCGSRGNIQPTNRQPSIEPDYKEVTIPYNIAPLNFIVKETGNYFRVRAKSSSGNAPIEVECRDGIIRFPEQAWKKLLASSKGTEISIEVECSSGKGTVDKYEPFSIHVADEPIDPFLAYRLIFPGYYSWSEMKIEQRSLESFYKKPVIDNLVIDKNCINCHSFRQNDPKQFMVHTRGSHDGTYFYHDGKITRVNLKTGPMSNGATYPYWHPGGRFVVYSSNMVRQSFYANHSRSIEVYDQSSSLIVYDIHENKVSGIAKDGAGESMQTFPTWSPDGKTLYFCEARLSGPTENWDIATIKDIHYNLVKKTFNEADASFGTTEMVFDAEAEQKSISFPRVSPDGRFLVFTMADYGTFPIWHKEADLYMLDLQDGKTKKMEVNSDETESYHSWSSNSKWLVFSSKRIDGRSARPFIAYIGSWDRVGKPFVVPQDNPLYYSELMQSYNIPELLKGEIELSPRAFEASTKSPAIKAMPGKFENTTVPKTNNQPEMPYTSHE